MFCKVKKVLDRTLEVLVTVSMGVLVVDVIWQVVSRYVLRNPSSWTEELATFLMIWVGLLGASVTLNRGGHLGIDYVTAKLPVKIQVYTELVVFFCVAMFSLLVLGIGGATLVRITLTSNQVSPALGLKMGYVYLAVPISGFFLTLYSIEFFIERVAALVKGKDIVRRGEKISLD
jgi:TRAP-type C4-dicarboxylate transport system permease small subunit